MHCYVSTAKCLRESAAMLLTTYPAFPLSFISRIIFNIQTLKLWKHKYAFVKESYRKGVLVGHTIEIKGEDKINLL